MFSALHRILALFKTELVSKPHKIKMLGHPIFLFLNIVECHEEEKNKFSKALLNNKSVLIYLAPFQDCNPTNSLDLFS